LHTPVDYAHGRRKKRSIERERRKEKEREGKKERERSRERAYGKHERSDGDLRNKRIAFVFYYHISKIPIVSDRFAVLYIYIYIYIYYLQS